MQTYFIADTHFYHKNIIKYDLRPFFSVTEMNSILIKNWNNRVTPKDQIYILGDFSWGSTAETEIILKQLNGHKHLIIGNHDEIITKSKKLQSYFDNISHYKKIKVQSNTGKKTLILSHYFIPFYDGHYTGAIHLHGHSHVTPEHNKELEIAKKLNDNGFVNKIFNVGCMHSYMDYTPITIDELLEFNTV